MTTSAAAFTFPTARQIAAEKERRRARKLYWSDPVAFIRDSFHWRPNEAPTAYQEEILSALPRRKRVAVRGPHGLGKTALQAWIVLWYALTRDGLDWKVPTTASAWRQLEKFLWPEIAKWSRRLRWDRLGRPPFDTRSELLYLSLKLRTGQAFAVASDKPDLIEGAHADHLLYVFDEAKAIPSPTFDAAEGAFSGAGGALPTEAFALATSTPGEPAGRFYDIHRRAPGLEDWWVRHVTTEEAIRAGRISREWCEQRKKQWGTSSAVYKNRVEGEFAQREEGGIIPLAWVEAANLRWQEWKDAGGVLGELDAVGVDVANGGEDSTVLAPKAGNIIDTLRVYPHSADTMLTCGYAAALLSLGGTALVDVIGVGAGVYDRLREQKKPVLPFNASAACFSRDRSKEFGFINLRAGAWWNLREMLNPDYGATLALPPDDVLTGDLTAPKWWVTSGGKIQVESKDDLRKPDRLGRSPDRGDAVMQACAKHLVVARGQMPVGMAVGVAAPAGGITLGPGPSSLPPHLGGLG